MPIVKPQCALIGGRVIPVTAPPIESGVVLISNGRIEAVGDESTPIPDDIPRIDTTGRWILPGLIDAHTHLGVLRAGDGWSDADLSESTEAVGARFRIIDGLNPADEAFRDAVAGGVLAAGVLPGSSSPIGGQTAAVRCHGSTVEEMVLRAPCGMKSGIGENPRRDFGGAGRFPGTRMGTAAVIRDAFWRARSYVDNPADLAGVNLDSAALAHVLSGEIPWRQHAHRADDIATAVRLSEELGYRLVIDHGTEADRLGPVLAERGVPVVTGPLLACRYKDEMRNRSLRTPARLAAAGVTIAIGTDHGVVPVQFLAYQAALAVREGLDPVVALEAITINPARILGVADRIGSLEPGKDADLCVWSGDPLDPRERVEEAYLGGRQLYRYDPDRRVGMLGGTEWPL